MSDNEVERATLKLSRCSRRPATEKVTVTTKHKRRKKKKKKDIPIPSFSPVDKLEDLDTSILDSPVKEEKKEVPVETAPIAWEDDDDDDDDLLLSGPVFSTAKSHYAEPEKPKSPPNSPLQDTDQMDFSYNEDVAHLGHEDEMGATDGDVDAESRTTSDSNKLPLTLVQKVDAMMGKVDFNTVTVGDLCNMALSGQGDDEKLRKLMRAHIKTLVASGNEVKPKATQKEHRRNKTTTCAPDKDALLVSVDNLFVHADPANVMVRDIIVALEVEYGAKLNKASRALVRTHLKDLVSGAVKPCNTAFIQHSGESRQKENSMPNIEQQVELSRQQEPSTAAASENAVVKTNMSARTERPERQIKLTKESQKKEIPIDQKKPATSKATKRGRPTTLSPIKEENESLDARAESEPVVQPVKKQPKKGARKRGRTAKPKEADQVIEIVEDSRQELVQSMEEPQKKKPAKRPRTRAKKAGCCPLCSTCTCRMKEVNEVKSLGSASLSRTDAQIERALIQRVKKLEGVVDKYEQMLDQVKRELKKHRRALLKSEEEQIKGDKNYAFGASRFLPDAEVWDEEARAIDVETLPSSVVTRAQETLFANRANYQPTLTQMMGGVTRKKEESTIGGDSGDDCPDEDVECLDPEVPTDADEAPVAEITESSDDALEIIDSGDECVDEEPQENVVDHVHRISYRNRAEMDAQSPLLRGSGVWSALTAAKCDSSPTAKSCLKSDSLASPRHASTQSSPRQQMSNRYKCAWDALFSENLESDESGMDQLVGLLEAEVFANDPVSTQTLMGSPPSPCSPQSEAKLTPLTQHGESIAEAIEDKIASDPMRLSAVEGVCPNWRENIRFALMQRSEDEVRSALTKVQQSMTNLNTMKEKVSALWKRQEVVLELFEMSLSESLARLTDAGKNQGNDNEGATEEDPDSVLHVEEVGTTFSQDDTNDGRAAA